MTKAFLGIDPGAEGAAFLITESRDFMLCRFKYSDSKHTRQWLLDVNLGFETFATIERVNARPGQDVGGVFNYGWVCGYIYGLIEAHFIPIQMVESKEWQYTFGLGGKQHNGPCKHKPVACTDCEYRARKKAHQVKAQELFPTFKVTLDMADAMLIAEHAYREGTNNHEIKPLSSRRAGTGIVRRVTLGGSSD